jgi:hypothetical protein
VALMRGHVRLAKRLLPMLLPHGGVANAILAEAFAAYPPNAVSFDLSPAPFMEYAMSQSAKRLDRLERSRAPGIPVGMKA